MRRALIPVSLLTVAGLAVGRLWLAYVDWESPTVWRMALSKMVAGTADRPFVTRTLPSLVIGGLARLTGWPLVHAAEAVMYLCAVGWLLALWWLARAVMSERAALVAALAAAGPVGLLFVSGGYTYDLPTLALITLALALLAHRQWNYYLALFPWIALCRETAVLLIPVFWLWRRRQTEIHTDILPRLQTYFQVLVFFGVRGALGWIFRNNNGMAFEQHWVAHWRFLISYPLPNVLALSVYGLALLVGLMAWRDQPAFLQDAALIIPVIFAAYWLVGFPGEIRVVLEAYPPLFLLAFHTVWMRGAEPAGRRIRGHCAALTARWRLIRG